VAGSAPLIQTQNPSAQPRPASRFNDRDLVKEFMDAPAQTTEIKTVPAGLPPLEIDDSAPAKPVATAAPAEEETSTEAQATASETQPQGDSPVAATKPSDTARTEDGAAPEGSVAAPAAAPSSTATPAGEPKAYDPAETVVLSPDGKVSWTKEQISTALRERLTLQETLEENTQTVSRLRGLFGPDEVVDKLWKPVVDRIRAHPEEGAFLGNFIDCDDEKRAWLIDASAKYDEEMGIPPPPPRAEVPPEVKAQLQRVEGYIKQQEQQHSLDRFNREMASLTAAYPFIATNEPVRQYIAGRAQQLYGQAVMRGVKPDDAPALLAAMEENRGMLEALKAGQGLPLAAATAPAPAVPVSAAVLPSTGAAPTTTRDRSVPKPKPGEKIDPVANWIAFSEGKQFKPKE
jgi:hypothetical protein